MKCELCHQAEAETRVWKKIDGEQRELYVCRDCARKREPAAADADGKSALDLFSETADLIRNAFNHARLHISLDQELSKLIKDAASRKSGSETGGAPSGGEGEADEGGPNLFLTREDMGVARKVPASHEVRCPTCGITHSEFRSGMRLGCPVCYKTFEEELAPEIREMQRPLDSGLPGAIGQAKDEESDESIRDVVLGCRVRLAANVKGYGFPDWMTDERRKALFDEIAVRIERTYQGMVGLAVSDMEEQHRQFLLECNVISSDLLNGPPGAGVLLLVDDPSLNVMVNEEDHIRYQCFGRGLDFQLAWDRLKLLSDAVERELPFARNEKYGRLTACPSNVGTGVRASAMLHLPALGLLQELDPVIRGLERLRISVRGGGGEGSSADGFIYQISNLDSLGMTAEAFIARVQRFSRIVVELERQARRRLLRDHPLLLQDSLARSLAVLKSARLISSADACSLLSMVRLGVAMGLLETKLDLAAVDDLMLTVKPAHFSEMLHRAFESDEQRDAARAKRLNHLKAKLRPF